MQSSRQSLSSSGISYKRKGTRQESKTRGEQTNRQTNPQVSGRKSKTQGKGSKGKHREHKQEARRCDIMFRHVDDCFSSGRFLEFGSDGVDTDVGMGKEKVYCHVGILSRGGPVNDGHGLAGERGGGGEAAQVENQRVSAGLENEVMQGSSGFHTRFCTLGKT